MKQRRQPRAIPPDEVPLDQGAREGTDEWKQVDGVVFCHWDRWLLRLALDEPEGLRAISSKFRARARRRKEASTRSPKPCSLRLTTLEPASRELEASPVQCLMSRSARANGFNAKPPVAS